MVGNFMLILPYMYVMLGISIAHVSIYIYIFNKSLKTDLELLRGHNYPVYILIFF